MSHLEDIGDCIVLNREPRGESSIMFTCLSQKYGLLYLIKRVSSSKTAQLPDIFDNIKANCKNADSNKNLKFLSDFEIIKRRRAIAVNYDAFVSASKITEIVIRNAKNIEDISTLYNRTIKALDALESSSPPNIVLIKFLYTLAKSEGYAVIEDFYKKLPEVQARLFAIIIKLPSKELVEFEGRCVDLAEDFSRWIYSETDII